MASSTTTTSLHKSFLHHRHPFTTPLDSSSIFFKPNNTCFPSHKFFSNLSSSTSSPSTTPTPTPTTSSSSASSSASFDSLAGLLASRDFRQADEETRRLLIVLAGEAARKRGYVFFSEVQFISADDLRAIDGLWRQHSGERFGYSVQRRIWEKSRRDFSRLFIKLGWMKKLDTEVEQYNYRSFPSEFIWELNDETPEGHLPLTNALRGTQLLASLLTHPAFEQAEDGEESESDSDDGGGNVVEEKERGRNKFMGSKTIFKPDYSF